MATYRELLKLVREGKSNQEIQDALKISTVAMQRLLSGKKIQRALAADREMSAQLATHRLVTATERIVERCLQLIEADNDETARRVAMELLERARQLLVESRPAPEKPMERRQTQELLKRMADVGIIHERYTWEGRNEYNWEWALREQTPLKVDFRKVQYGDEHYLEAFDKFKREYRAVRQDMDRRQKEICDSCELRKRCKEIKQGCLKPPPAKPVADPPVSESQQQQQGNNEDTGETPVRLMGGTPMLRSDTGETPVPQSVHAPACPPAAEAKRTPALVQVVAPVRRKAPPAIIHSPVSGMPYNGPRRQRVW